jgi:hypothetical protein
MRRSTALGLTVGLVASIAIGALVVAAPEMVYSAFIPSVIPADAAGPVLFEARVAGSPTHVVLVLNARDGSTSNRALRDDGLAGDRTRSDGIYTLRLTAAEIVGLLKPDDVLRAEVGYLEVYDGTTLAGRSNVFADVLTSEVPLVPVTRLAPDAQQTDYLVNLVVPGFVTTENYDIVSVTQRFYALFGDDFDFLNLISVPSFLRNRFHVGVKNDVRGIGVEAFDETARYGSAGRLLGITVFPIQYFFDGAEPAYQHELGHQWINFLPFAPLNYAIPHWPLSDLASGIMGFAEAEGGQGLQFPCIVTPAAGGATLTQRYDAPVFTDLDLYLMGLLSADQVGTHVVFPRGTTSADLFSLCGGGTWQGQLQTVTIQDIVRQVGARVPDAAHSAHAFRVATIIVSPDGLLSREAMSFYSYFARRAQATGEVLYHSGFAKGTAKPFAISTRGLGSIDARIVATTAATATIFDAVGFADILARSGSVSAAALRGSGLTPGTVLFYITNARYLGKLEVLETGYNLVIRFVTYGAGASVRASSERLVIPGTFLADLDTGAVASSGADFQWSQQSETARYLTPVNGALFALWAP